jgi:proline racemase
LIAIITTIDCHVAGQVVRLVTGGMPRALGTGPVERAAWFERHADHLRRALVLEPRGHADMTAVALTEASPPAHAGLLFMDGGGYPRFVAGAAVAAATLCIERQLIVTGEPEGPEQTLVFDTAIGTVRARARVARANGDGATGDAARVTGVSLEVGPAFVHTASSEVRRGSRRVPLDVAFGGDFLAIVDSETAGVPLDRAHIEDVRRVGLELCAVIDGQVQLAHPRLGGTQALAGVVLTGPPSREAAHLRGAVVNRHGVVDRSALSGSAAVMAVLAAMGIVAEGQPFVHEGTSGLTVEGTLVRRTTVGDLPAVELEVAASAWVIGEHVWHLHEHDPLRYGDEGE